MKDDEYGRNDTLVGRPYSRIEALEAALGRMLAWHQSFGPPRDESTPEGAELAAAIEQARDAMAGQYRLE